MSGVVASLWAMVVLGLMVSAVGVTNTLTINVLEQTRELGLLRIVAMTQNQVRKTIFTQAMIMALLALMPGIVAGVAVAYLINVAMMPVLGHPVQFTFHPVLLVRWTCGRFGGCGVARRGSPPIVLRGSICSKRCGRCSEPISWMATVTQAL